MLTALLFSSGCSDDSGGGGAAYAPYGESGPVGLAALRDLDALPRLRRGVHTIELSSYDREGFNDSGFSGSEEFLHLDDDGAAVLVDVQGPGVIYDLYLAWLSFQVTPEREELILSDLGPVQIYLDGAQEPVVELRPDGFFDKRNPPFLAPYVFDTHESGLGTVSYLPIPFRKSCLIRLAAGPKPLWFYQIWIQRLRDAGAVAPFDPAESIDGDTVLDRPVGDDPKDPEVRSSNDLHEGRVRIAPPGADVTRAVIFEAERGGRVQSIRLRPHLTASAAHNLLRSLWIEMEWDGELAVEAPLALFFATGHRTKPAAALPAPAVVSTVPAQSLLIGEGQDGFLYSYFPMPFAKSARISLAYHPTSDPADALPPIDVDYEIETHALRRGESPGSRDGTFRTQHRKVDRSDFGERIPLGDDYVVLETRGTGHYVGVVMLADDTQETFLEGDERIYVDGSRTPQIIGTATETFFQGGWYFQETAFSLPLHGAPVLTLLEGEVSGKMDATMYRLHVSDLVPFYDSIRFGIMHGAINNIPVSYETLAFYYAVDDSSLTLTDEVDIGDPRSEQAHALTTARPLPGAVALTAFYEGDRDGSTVGVYEEKSLGELTPQAAANLNLRIIAAPPAAPLPEESPDGVADDGRDLAAAHQFRVSIGAENDGVKLRRRFDQGQGRQRARVSIDGTYAGIWTYEGTNPHKRWRDDDFEVPARLTAGKREITIGLEPLSGSWTAYYYWIFCYAPAL